MVQVAEKRKYKRISIDEDIYNLLEKFARKHGRTKNGIAQEAIITYLTVMVETEEGSNEKK